MCKILFLSQLLPYPHDTGAKVRSYNTLRYLSQKHQVTLLAFTRPDDPPGAVAHLREICKRVATVPIHRSHLQDALSVAASMIKGKSFVIERDHFPEMDHKVHQLMADEAYDAIHADQLWMAQYAIWAKSLKTGVRLVMDEHNACYQIFQRLAIHEPNPIKRIFLEREWRALRRYEAYACAQFDHVVTVTHEDRAILTQMLPSVRTKKQVVAFSTIPICVDTQEVLPVKATTSSCNIFHLGTMYYLPNVTGMLWFTREVWPKVLYNIPQATLTIAGKNPPPEIQELSISKEGNTHIQVTGYVPDPQEYLEKANVFIVPVLEGGGMRVKIIDAWRWGMPIVSTSIGAEGIVYRDGENILIADSADAFAMAVERVLLDHELARCLRENGRRWVEQHYNWRQVYPAWDTIYPPAAFN